MAGGALGYNACVQAHRQRYALEQRFAALEARLQAAQSNGGLVQTSATNNRGVFVRTAVHRSEETYSTLVTVSGPQLFAPGRAELLPESFDYLQQISDNLADQPTTRVVVMGHVDPSETESGGQALSQARADAVMAFLVRQGINPARMSAHGLGTSRLVDPSGRTDAPLRNRRVEVALISTDTGDAETGSASKSIKS